MKKLLAVTMLVTAAALIGPAALATPAATHHTTVGTKHGDGRSVLEARSRFVYTHLAAGGKEVGCSASCLKIWPLVTSRATPRAIDGVKQHRLGTTAHHQVTYYGHRLYYFTYDSPTVPFGRGITSFGGKWRLITVTGTAG